MSDNEAAIRRFAQETGAPEAVARNALAIQNGNYVRAKQAYLASRQASSSSSAGGVATLSSLKSGSGGGAGGKKQNELFGGGHASGIATLGPRRNDGDDDDDDDEHGGGGRDAPGDVNPLVQSVFDNARRQGAVEREPEQAQQSAPKDRFVGSGRRLGDGGVSPTVTPAGGAAAAAAPKKNEAIVITFYRNGFTTAADGPLRLYDDPAQKAFLDSINQGRVPAEFHDRMQQGGSNVLDVSLADHKNEDWAPPSAAGSAAKPHVAAFTGQGQTLGGASTAAAATAAPPIVRSGGSGRALVVDETQPTTSLRVRLLDGRQIVVKCNHTHTIADIRAHADAEAPPATRYLFVCTSMRPPKRDLNEALTVKDADLLNATLHQQNA